MRIVVFILAALAAVKIYTQDQTYRAATTDVLIDAYRGKAIAACSDYRARQGLQTSSPGWSNTSPVALQIGRSDLDIGIWQFEDSRWEAAYRRAYLVLAPADPRSSLTCTYDITSGRASISRSS